MKATRFCSVIDCHKPHYGKGLCQMHYHRQRRHGTVELIVPEPKPRPTCSVLGCNHVVGTKSARGLCASHYSRLRRTGNLDESEPLRAYGVGKVDTNGYRVIRMPSHPLARKHGDVAEHRVVAYAKYGPGLQRCHWCNRPLRWADVHVDHLDGVRLNNHPSNLVTACQACNKERGAAGNPIEFHPRGGRVA